jgi:tetratricopeptide (TPR) repeat protein
LESLVVGAAGETEAGRGEGSCHQPDGCWLAVAAKKLTEGPMPHCSGDPSSGRVALADRGSGKLALASGGSAMDSTGNLTARQRSGQRHGSARRMSETLAAGAADMSETRHLSAELFRRFLEQRASRSERRAVVRHLLTQCPECLALAARITAEGGYWFGKAGAEALVERDYAAAFRAACKFATQAARRVAFERLRGWAHWSALDPLPPNERLPTVVMRKDWHHWGLFRALLDAARWYSSRDPQEAADIVRLALDVVDLLDPQAAGGNAAAKDMRAKAWAILGNCRRLAADLDGAREAIAEAWRLNEEGAGDPLDKAQIWSCDASYARAIGELETAETILEKALSLYLAAGDAHLQGRTLIQMGKTIGYVDPDRGIAHLEHGLQLINPVREPRLELCAQHALAHFLAESGRPRQALAILDRARPLYGQFPDDWVQLRLHWLQGRIAHALEQFGEAAHILRQVQEDFRAWDLHRDFLLVSIDLAEAHVAAGETATARRRLAEVTPLLTSWSSHRNALAAWLLFQKTLEERSEAGAAVGTLFSQLRLYYCRYWHVPTAELSLD